MAESASIPVLHSYWRSSAAYRVRIALALKGQPYRSVTWQMAQGEHLQPTGAGAWRRSAWCRCWTLTACACSSRWPSSSTWRNATPNPRCCRQARAARARALAQLIACEVHPLNNLRALKRLRTQFGADDDRSASGIAIGATRPFPPSRPRWATTTARPTRWATRPASSSVS